MKSYRPVGLIALLLCLFLLIPIQAQEEGANDAKDQSGSADAAIFIELESGPDEKAGSVCFELYRLADFEQNAFRFEKTYVDCALSPDEMDQPQKIEPAMALLSSRKQSPIAQARTDENGRAIFRPGQTGLYLVHTLEHGPGRRIPDFLVTLPGVDEKEGMSDQVIVNPKSFPLPVLSILKTDHAGKAILGKEFEFTAYLDAGCSKERNKVSGAVKSGEAVFELSVGETLYIKETKAPDGYRLRPKALSVSLKEDGFFYLDGVKQEEKDLRTTIPFVNEKIEETTASSQVSSTTRSEKKEPAPVPRTDTKAPSTAAGSAILLAGALLIGSWCLLMVLLILQRRRKRS